MSNAGGDEIVKSAVPLADLGVVERALRGAGSLRDAVKTVRPADLGRDLSRRNVADGKRILEAADERHASAMLRAAHPAVASNVLATLPPSTAATLLSFLPTDQQVAILAPMRPAARTLVDAALPPAQRSLIEGALAFPETACARIMTTKVWRVPRGATAADALAILRTHDADIEVGINAYVVDGDRLAGVIALRELAVLPGDAKVAEHMTSDVIAVSQETDRKDAAEIIQTHDFLSLPVIDKAGKLVGAVRLDDLFDVALGAAGAGILNQGGVAGKIASSVPYFQQRVHRVVRSRITWLVLLFVAETATGTVLRHFEDELAKVVALSFFVPLIIGTGGNAGSQTVSTIIRALAIGEVRMSDAWRVLAKEALTGILLGVCLAGIAFGRALLWGVGMDLAACVAVTVAAVCIWANLVGSLIPIGAQKVGVDPTVISGPLITTLVDASGLFIYFTVAHLMIAALAST